MSSEPDRYTSTYLKKHIILVVIVVAAIFVMMSFSQPEQAPEFMDPWINTPCELSTQGCEVDLGKFGKIYTDANVKNQAGQLLLILEAGARSEKVSGISANITCMDAGFNHQFLELESIGGGAFSARTILQKCENPGTLYQVRLGVNAGEDFTAVAFLLAGHATENNVVPE